MLHPELFQTAALILCDYGKAREGDRVLLVTDPGYSGEVLAALQGMAMARSLALTTLTLLPNQMKQPPETFARTLEVVDLAVVCTSRKFHASFADFLARGGRVLSLTRTTPQQLGQVLSLDREALRAEMDWFGQKLAKCRSMELTTALGTRLTLNVTGRKVLFWDGEVSPGEFDTYPGVVSITPVEAETGGRLVVDCTVGWIPPGEDELFNMNVAGALTLEIVGGRVARVTGGLEAPGIQRMLRGGGEGADVVAEIGLGLNAALRAPTGNLLLDEHIYGAVHIGVGNNLHLGGKNQAGQHADFVIKDATIHCDGELAIEDGRLIGFESKGCKQ